MGKTRGC